MKCNFSKGKIRAFLITFSCITALIVVFLPQLVLAQDAVNKNVQANTVTYECQQFSYLAKSFLHGQLHFLDQPGGWGDTAFYKGKYYWPLGPFPAVLLIPFVYIFDYFNIFFKQDYLQIFIIILIFYFLFIITKRNGFSKIDSISLSIAFCLSSVFLGVALRPWSWYYAQVVTTLLLFLCFLEYIGKKRYAIIGLVMGFVLLTRVTASIGIFFFCLDIFKKSKSKFKDIVYLLVPFVIMGLIFAVYNFERFGNIFEQGYSYQIIPDYSSSARNYGLFGFVHLPTNLYYFLLSGPLPVFRDNVSHVLGYPFFKANPWGMSIFITSPYLVYLFFQKYHDWESKSILATAFLISVPIFLYYASGYFQFGYRYSLDFLPFLHFLLIRIMDKKAISDNFKMLILCSAIFNFYLYLSSLKL